MNDPRLTNLGEALTRFAERLTWLRPFQSAEDPATLEQVRSILDEWVLIEPHLELLEAVTGKQSMEPILARVESLRAQVRMAFLLEVGKLLQVMELRWTNEMLMRVPMVLKKVTPEEQSRPEVAKVMDELKVMLKEWPEPERMFRESMQAADNCESASVALHKKLKEEWPEEWTPAMQARLETADPPGLKAWRDELRSEYAELQQRLTEQA